MDLQRATECIKLFYSDNKRHMCAINCYAFEYIIKILDDAITMGIKTDKEGHINER